VADTAEQLAVGDWYQTIAMNLRGAFLVSQQIGRIMLAKGSGTVINLARKRRRSLCRAILPIAHPIRAKSV
jgi:NADP-dependent 3-hydroxy acid dehydrogenase YdfG